LAIEYSLSQFGNNAIQLYQILVGSAGYPPILPPWSPSVDQSDVDVDPFPLTWPTKPTFNAYRLFYNTATACSLVCDPSVEFTVDYLSPILPADAVIVAEQASVWPTRIEISYRDSAQGEWKIAAMIENYTIGTTGQNIIMPFASSPTSRFWKFEFTAVQGGGTEMRLRMINMRDASGVIIALINSRIETPTIALSKPGADAALLFDNQSTPLAAPAWSVSKFGGAYVVLEPKRAVTSVEMYGSNKNTFPLINTLMHGPSATGPWTLAASKSTRAASVFGANYSILNAAIDELEPAVAVDQSGFAVLEDSGVVLGPWFPSMMTRMAWYDADDTSTVYLLNGNVFQWRDKSGNGLHLTQNADANQPLFQPNGFNSLPTVSFDGANDFFRADTIAAALANDDYTMFLVFSTALNLSTTEFVINMASSTRLYVFSADGQISVQMDLPHPLYTP
jgi:hypothetical protein